MKIKRKTKWILISAITLIVLLFVFYIQGGYTSDAYIRANWAEISPRVEEFVVSVEAKTNTFVQKGDTLFSLDSYTYKMTVEKIQAELELANATKNLYSDEVKNYTMQLDAINDQMKLNNQEVVRYKFLMEKQAGSVETYQDKLYAFEKDKIRQAEILTALDDAKNNVSMQDAQIRELTADLGIAQYNLESTTVKAPFDGYIVNNYLMPGMYVKPGQSVFGIVESQNCWVEANLKEFWVGRVKPGQTVYIMPDLYPFKIIRGEVVSIISAISRTQTEDKTLPYVEPTIDWLRLQQRFTVIIKIKHMPEYMRLRMGSSARVYIDFY